jgi:hypothetical protein
MYIDCTELSYNVYIRVLTLYDGSMGTTEGVAFRRGPLIVLVPWSEDTDKSTVGPLFNV